MEFRIDSAVSLAVSDAEITDLLSQVYVVEGFTAPEVAKILFAASAVRSKGANTLCLGRSKLEISRNGSDCAARIACLSLGTK